MLIKNIQISGSKSSNMLKLQKFMSRGNLKMKLLKSTEVDHSFLYAILAITISYMILIYQWNTKNN